jgi:hypothetical protein
MSEVIEPTPAPAPAAPPADKWYSGLDADAQSYITSRGLADKDPVAAFLETAKAHKEAQAYIGVPKEQLLKLPKADAPPEEWDAVYERLGYSKNADDYKLEGLKHADGTDVDDATKDFIRSQATELKLSPQAAQKLAENTIKRLDDTKSASTADEAAAATKALEQLKQSWGPNYEAYKVIADRGYEALMKEAGLDQAKMTAAIQKLGEATGKAETMQLLLAVGKKLGEDNFVGGGGPSGNTYYTKETALARLSELKADSSYTARYLAGGMAEKKEMENLHAIAYGVQ